MKKFLCHFPIVFACSLLAATGVRATIFTNNTTIGSFDTNYEGADITITNCTVTVDGQHSFNSLQVASGGVLTHSFFANGLATYPFNITDEPQVLTNTNPVALLQSNVVSVFSVTDSGHTIIYTNNIDYALTNLPDGSTQIYRTDTSLIPDGATVLVTYTWSDTVTAGLYLTVTNDVTIASGGSVNANGTGYGPGLGTGRGFSSSSAFFDGSGASHGGLGGTSASNAVVANCYGTLYQPVTLGSGGGASYAGSGGNGGGLIRIAAGGTVNIDGSLTVNGTDATNSRAGGGAGGSIWITAANVTGAGSLTANGGAGEPIRGGGGGGGRISFQCVTNNFSGTCSAYGGSGAISGGAGTIFTQTNDLTGLLLVDNGNRTGANTAVTLPTTADVLIHGNAGVVPSGTFNPRHLTIGANSILTGVAQTNLAFSVGGNLTIQTGGALMFDSLGYSPGTGGAPGNYYASASYPCGGGGYGGYGAAGSVANASGGTGYYGFQMVPVVLGSGGGYFSTSSGGYGGGAVQINVTGTLQVDGRISANGGNGSGTGGGGGAGGSIYIANCTTLAGSGSITANGGSGVALLGGGGGGGRIAVTAINNLFTGVISAYGGGGANYGGAGTIFTDVGGAAQLDVQQLTLDNGGHLGTNTVIQTISSAALNVRNGAKATTLSGSSATFNSLLVNSNGWLTHLPASSLTLAITGDAIIQSGGGFVGDALGRVGGQGIATGGASSTANFPCGGGGYGGKGGNAFTNSAAGGVNTGDTAAFPSATYSGSGGGSFVGSSPTSAGGSGGGFLQLTVNGKLQLDGVISANGTNGTGLGGGGGAGGGAVLNVGTFAGSGNINVNGGAGVPAVGGGGGGGRIAVYFNTNIFSGALTAFGGSGANFGGGGTIYFKTNSAIHAQVIVDNAGHAGADTTWNSSATTDLILRNGSSCFLSSGTTSFGNLTISSNAWLFASNSSISTITINAGNITVQSGGNISADSAGNNANSGNGAGNGNGAQSPYYPCGGGGHGGYGAIGNTNYLATVYPAGNYYDTASSPFVAGSGGGGITPYSIGGKGGGSISFSLSGNLQMDGTLSANGGNGSGIGGGGGSGGAMNIICANLTGSGSIAANGGLGMNNIGGGGSGGMIAATFTSNLFSGTISAVGGGGANYGGTGTIYFRTNNTGQTLLIFDNAGHRGANTPLATANNLIIRNGAVACTLSSGTFSYTSLLITSNGWLTPNLATGQNTVNISTSGNTTIQAGGGIVADTLGSAQNNGTGHGNYYGVAPYYQCSGAGHGGFGAIGYTNTTVTGGSGSGITYDSTTTPTSTGSGGGGNLNQSVGGNGGGYVRLSVTGTLQMDGVISANGGNGTSTGGGGGSGGSIYLTPGVFNGSGSIIANGGKGAGSFGGGGGGGRIAVYFNNKNFTGGFSAFGGGGFAYGGAGTVFTRTNNQSYGLLVLDNNNNAGTNTSFDITPMDVTIQNQAIGLLPVSGSWSPHNVLIRTNGFLAAPVSTSLRTISANNLTIDAGGALTLDNAGNTAQSGAGFGSSSLNAQGGGGHGGYGGGNPVNFGKAYDSIQAPVTTGSGGGSYNSGPPYSYGGNGGGALQLNVISTLTVNGKLSANGGNGDFNSGGGSGGSLYFQNVFKLTGNGLISANGGSATGAAGSGGGGRISLTISSNSFTGQISAYGGNGSFPGGAGTIYNGSLNSLLVDNGGIVGTNTPLGNAFSLPATPFDLNISGAAVVVPITPLPLLNNLNLAAGSTLTLPFAQSNLFLTVKTNANLAGALIVDYLGFPQTNGPGAGSSLSVKGSGGGYGGAGGNSSSGAPGGTIYGSAAQPVNFGSGGGNGLNNLTGGSEGGGALRISVGGTLNVNGNVSANGDYGWQDDSGGGSGGSIWITANTLTGLGNILATGGNGDLAGGGGGGGGRIAIYSPTNLFLGSTNVNGGGGATPGQTGTIFLSTTLLNFQVLSNSPNGTISNTVSFVDLYFSEAVDPASIAAATFTLTNPAGIVSPASLTAVTTDPATVRVSFPVQNVPGNYSLQVATSVTNIFGLPLAQSYTGNFTIVVPTISGTITNLDGTPVAGVLLQPDGGLTGATTDGNGNYSIGVPPGWNGTITPSLGSFIFVPGFLSYTNLPNSLTNQNYLMMMTSAPTLTTGLNGVDLSIGWTGISGVTYQAWWSTNLVNWSPYGGAISGTNGPMQILLPLNTDPAAFFRLGATP